MNLDKKQLQHLQVNRMVTFKGVKKADSCILK